MGAHVKKELSHLAVPQFRSCHWFLRETFEIVAISGPDYGMLRGESDFIDLLANGHFITLKKCMTGEHLDRREADPPGTSVSGHCYASHSNGNPMATS